MKKYNAAIIGCGKIGSEFDINKPSDMAFSHAGAYSVCSKTSLISASDLDPAKLNAVRKKWAVNSVYPDYKKMLKSEQIDILSICTPPDTHCEIVKYASKLPLKAILCEKPISSNLEDAENMITACKEAKILLMVNHQRRFFPFFRELRQKISSGHMGRIQHINCYYTRGIFNAGTHIIDLFSFLFGSPEWLAANYSQNKSPFVGDPNLDAVIKFKNGPLVSMRACDDSCYLIFETDIITSRARIRMGKELEYFKADKGRNVLNKNELFEVKISPFRHAYGPVSLTYGVEHVINCLEHKEKPISSGEDAIHALKIIETMLSSAKYKKTSYF